MAHPVRHHLTGYGSADGAGVAVGALPGVVTEEVRRQQVDDRRLADASTIRSW